MKKYLMMGAAALTMGFAFVSCSSDDEIYNPNADALTDNYQSSFEKNVGKPAAGHTWGFNQTRATRTANTNNNQWFDPQYCNYEQPADITKAEIAYVENWFKKHGKNDGQTLDVNNYFVQQVSYSSFEYTAHQHEFEKFEGGNLIFKTGTETVKPIGHMDQIYANLDENGTKSDHVNNFNTGSGSIMLMEDSETQYGFGYEESWGTDEKHVWNNYLMAHIVGTTTDDDGNEVKIDGWYVGFDYQTYKNKNITYQYTDNGETKYGTTTDWAIDPNGVYDDRIVKIVPAKKKGVVEEDEEIIHEQGRIFCEDLGFIGDFDFNDVVFDAKVYYWKNAGTPSHTDITLLAAGGTMKIKVAGVDVHEAFGQPDSKMINTGDDSKCVNGLDPVPFRAETAYASLIEIPIAVQHGNAVRVLEAQPGKAPQKYVAPIGTKWADEYVNVTKVYPKFKEWVEKESVTPEWANANTILTNKALADNAAELAK